MKSAITMILLLITGQASAERLPYGVSVFHDIERGATCWIYSSINRGGISCLPDSSLPQAPAGTSTDETQAARASIANTEAETGQFPAASLPQKTGFQL